MLLISNLVLPHIGQNIKINIMVSLKRNKNGEFVKATGIRSRASSIYKPNQKEDYKSAGTIYDYCAQNVFILIG